MNKTPFAFILSGVLILLFTIVFSNSNFNLNLHDTYIIISYLHISIVVCIYFIFIGLIYLISKKLNNKLGVIHLVASIFPIIISIASSYILEQQNLENVKRINYIIAFSALIIIIGQIIFTINIFKQVFKKYFSRNNP
jgi:heme/copper-type cytochrome/quinol oxidase subunit 1